MSAKLKPCPFCGAEAQMDKVQFGFEAFTRYSVGCPACDFRLGWDEDEKAEADKWNRRFDNGTEADTV